LGSESVCSWLLSVLFASLKIEKIEKKSLILNRFYRMIGKGRSHQFFHGWAQHPFGPENPLETWKGEMCPVSLALIAPPP